ncbi:hypothetical protein [Halobaculum litoreum]|uniref:Uncharacterized protein n=1 Tax=Halobaculum litoreum TaxID=3031998 RepID=A0ABD5XRV1_9EURY|nr:hypothetical protein [Halobaculum sp. DT92]
MDDSDGADGGDAPVDPWADDADDDWVADATAEERSADGAAATARPDDDGRAGAPRSDEDGDGGAPAAAADDAADAGLGARRYRVLDRAEDALVFVDLDTPDPGPGPAPDEGFEPVRVAAAPADGTDSADLADALDALEPGYVVTARLRWPDPADGADPSEGARSRGWRR